MTEDQPPTIDRGHRAGGEAPAGDAGGVHVPTSLMKRFGLEWSTIVVIALVSTLIWFAVWKCGNEAYGGILGRPLRVGIVPWPGYARGLGAHNGLRRNKDPPLWKQHQR